MSDTPTTPQHQDEVLEAVVPAAAPTDASLRLKLEATRDKIIHEAATNLIKWGNELPRLKKAGYWLYGAATRYLPRGREVDKLGPVGDTVWRGAQPSLAAFEGLREMGIDTVINLRPESDYERKAVARLGMRYFYMPLPPLDKPTHDLTKAFLDAVTDPANGKVFFHCYHGVDRTGTMAACLRIARDDWSVDAALAEMRAYKVHESGQRAKVAYLQEFSDWWHSLPLAERCAILHRPLPEAPAVEPVKQAWWRRAMGWVGEKFNALKGESGG